MIANPWILYVAFPLAAYAVGSTPFGVLLASMHGKDLRNAGSGNVGATNCARVLGWRWGILCFLLDFAKGFVPTLAAVLLTSGDGGQPAPGVQAAWLAAGMGAILGHMFPFWLRFSGGKGVATALGVVLGIFPQLTWPGLCAFALWIVVAVVTRYISVASLAAAGAFGPLFVAFNWPVGRYWPICAFVCVMVILIVWRHRSNIRRLLARTENRIGAARNT